MQCHISPPLTHLNCFHLSLINIPLLVYLVSVSLPLCQFVFVLCIKRPSNFPVIFRVFLPAYSRLCHFLLSAGLFA